MMRSFKATAVPDTEPLLRVGPLDWHELVALACRDCEDATGVGTERTEFIPDCRPKVGEELACPFCGTFAVVPKKSRWA